jgi:hypothetical protein
MGHGLRCPLSVYVLPEGVRYLVIEVAGRNGGSMLCSELGAAAVHVVMDDGSPDGLHRQRRVSQHRRGFRPTIQHGLSKPSNL